MYQMPQRIPGGSLLEVQNYEFNFTVPQGSTEWIDQSIGVEVPPGGTRLVVSVASWRIDIGSLESKVWQFGVRAFANPNQFPWITASIVLLGLHSDGSTGAGIEPLERMGKCPSAHIRLSKVLPHLRNKRLRGALEPVSSVLGGLWDLSSSNYLHLSRGEAQVGICMSAVSTSNYRNRP